MEQQNQGNPSNQNDPGQDANLRRDPQQQDRGQADVGRQQQGSNPSGGQSQSQGMGQQEQGRSRSRVDQDDLDARSTSNRGEV